MKESRCTVAVDVGNSAVKLCICKGQPDKHRQGDREPEIALPCHTVRIVGSAWQQDAVRCIRHHLNSDPAIWRIASVRDGAADRLHRTIVSEMLNATVYRIKHVDVPMGLDVDQPENLGIDRLLGAYAAWNRWQRAVVVVDAGSAITVDWVTESGRFGGGGILPGLRLQTQGLANGTDALSEIDWQSVESDEQELDRRSSLISPAKNTDDAIRLGVLAGAAAAIDRLAEGYHAAQRRQVPPQNSSTDPLGPVVLTGGDASILSRHMRLAHELVPNLVCHGLLEIPQPECQSSLVS